MSGPQDFRRDSGNEGRPWSWLDVAALGLVLLLALWLRLPHLHDSLWLDELHTSWTAGGRLAELPSKAALGNTSPAYFLAPWATTRLLGEHEWALRLPSLVANLGLIVLLYVTLLHWTGSRSAALLAALLAAVDRDFLFYALEARAYALVQVVGLVQVLVFAQLNGWGIHTASSHVDDRPLVPSRKLRIGLVLLTTLLFYLHYTATLLLGAEIAAYAILLAISKRPVKYSPAAFAIDTVAVLLLCLPATGHLAEIAARRDNWKQFVTPQPLYDIWWRFTLDVYVGLPLLLAGVAALWRYVARRRPRLHLPSGRVIVLVACWLLLPVLLAWLLTQLDVAALYFRRYVIVSTPAAIVLASLACATIASRAGRIAAVTLVFLVACLAVPPRPFLLLPDHGTLAPRTMVDRPNEDWRAAIGWINKNQDGKAFPVLVRAGLIEANAWADDEDPLKREFCLIPVTGMYRISGAEGRLYPLPNRISAGWSLQQSSLEQDHALLAAVRAAGGLWLVVRGDQRLTAQVQQQIAHELQADGCGTQRTNLRSFGHVCAVRMEVACDE